MKGEVCRFFKIQECIDAFSKIKKNLAHNFDNRGVWCILPGLESAVHLSKKKRKKKRERSILIV